MFLSERSALLLKEQRYIVSQLFVYYSFKHWLHYNRGWRSGVGGDKMIPPTRLAPQSTRDLCPNKLKTLSSYVIAIFHRCQHTKFV